MATAYRIGIDIGLGAVGLVAVELDENQLPTKFLNIQTVTHDLGVDPGGQRTGKTRVAVAGVARRSRRMLQRRRNRLQQLDRWLEDNGYPVVEEPNNDPYLPWRIRAELAQKRQPRKNRKEKIAIAIRHIARHRGWRNPYSSVAGLHHPAPPSEQLIALRKRISARGTELSAELTPGELIASYGLTPEHKLRGNTGILAGKLMQSDNANELRKIAEVQKIPAAELHKIIEAVFKSQKPEGKTTSQFGYDPLPGQEYLPRAPKAHSAFQRFRIAAVLANMRIKQPDGELVRLTIAQRVKVFDQLLKLKPAITPSWDEVANWLGVEKQQLIAIPAQDYDDETPGSRPPIDETSRRVLTSKIKP
ncbi:MAG: HNH endonuclease, partial [Actinomycetales bacterium]